MSVFILLGVDANKNQYSEITRAHMVLAVGFGSYLSEL